MHSRGHRLSLIAACIVCAGEQVRAGDAVIREAKILSYGLHLPQGTQKWGDTNALSGQIRVHDSVAFSETTTNVPAVLGVNFGFEYIIVGEPTNAVVEVTVVRKYPPPGIKPPGAGRPAQESRRQWKVTLGEKTGTGYGFDHDWEIVPGVWTFQIWTKDRMLLEQTFQVRKQEQDPSNNTPEDIRR